MKIEYWTEAERLTPLVTEWYKEQNGSDFGVHTDVDVYIKGTDICLKTYGGAILVMLDETKAIGFLTLIVVPSELGNQLWAHEKGWYVLPNTRSGMRLYRQAEKWCKENGCSHLVMSASNLASNLHDKVCRFYDHMGMQKFETSYIKEL